MKQWLLDVLKGVVIGIANIIPGVSGGTMMIVMGIYDKLIYCINNLFKQFGSCIKILLPYGVGIGLALVTMSSLIGGCMENFPLPTALVFTGLILGGIPAIVEQVRDVKIKPVHVLAFLLAAGLLVGMQFMPASDSADLSKGANVLQMLIILVMGVIASSTMIIPGVSGSMMLLILGYYHPIFGCFGDLGGALLDGQWGEVGRCVSILLPFVAGMGLGLLGISRAIEVMLKKWKGLTYAIILGLVIPSPIVILMSTWQEQSLTMADVNVGVVVASVVALVIGIVVAGVLMPMLDAKVKGDKAEQ